MTAESTVPPAAGRPPADGVPPPVAVVRPRGTRATRRTRAARRTRRARGLGGAHGAFSRRRSPSGQSLAVRPASPLPLLAVDVAAALLAVAAGRWWPVAGFGWSVAVRGGGRHGLATEMGWPVVVLLVTVTALGARAGLYGTRALPPPPRGPLLLDEVPTLCGRIAAAWVGLAALLAGLYPAHALSLPALASGCALHAAVCCAGRGTVHWRRRRAAERHPRPTLVIGTPATAPRVAAALLRTPRCGLNPVGVACFPDGGGGGDGDEGDGEDEDEREGGAGRVTVPRLPVLTTAADVRHALVQQSVRAALLVSNDACADTRPYDTVLQMLMEHRCPVWRLDTEPAGEDAGTGARAEAQAGVGVGAEVVPPRQGQRQRQRQGQGQGQGHRHVRTYEASGSHRSHGAHLPSEEHRRHGPPEGSRHVNATAYSAYSAKSPLSAYPGYPIHPGYPRYYRHPGNSGHLAGFPCTPLYPVRTGRATPGKRVLDVAVSGMLLMLTGPVLLACAAMLRISGGPGVVFQQERVGKDGRTFTLLKFRTHRPAEPHEAATRWSIAGERRMSRFCRFLRRTSLDELPQLWNVFRGDMSLVGPRPERPYFVAQFSRMHPGYARRHRMQSGMTGLAQIHGLRGDTSIEDRCRFDNAYIDTWSLWQDICILLRTVAALVRVTGS